MKRCPKCNKEISDNAKYCQYCGYNVTGDKNKNLKMFLFFILPFLGMILPALTLNYYSTLTHNIPESGDILLQDVKGYAPTYIIKTYDSLEEFDSQFSNVDSFVNGVKEFEESLTKDGLYTVEKDYKFEMLDNLNINYHLYYDIEISDRLTLNVYKTFDRLNLFNNETYSITTHTTDDFNQLLLTDDEIKTIGEFIEGEDTITKLVNEFSKRENEFELKKDSLGHYGIGNYEEDYSFVTYKKDDLFYSKLKYRTGADELIK